MMKRFLVVVVQKLGPGDGQMELRVPRTWGLSCYISFTQMKNSSKLMSGIGVERKSVGLDDQLLSLSWEEMSPQRIMLMGSWVHCDAWLNHQGGRGFFPKVEEEWPGGFVPLSEILLYILCISMTECITDSFSVSLFYNIVRSLGTGVIYSKMNWRYLINIGLNGKCWVHYEKQM